MPHNYKIGDSVRQQTVKLPFSVQDVSNFTARNTHDRDVVRSLEVLEKNGSVAKCNETTWQITPRGIQHIYDFVMRRKPNDNLKP